jgi:hypothetical protein
LPDNLVSIIARRVAGGVVMALVYAGAALAVVALSVLGYTSRPRTYGGAGLIGLVLVVAAAGAALAAENVLVTDVWPGLMPAVRP